jgi:hypothetical protein
LLCVGGTYVKNVTRNESDFIKVIEN